VFLKIKSKFLHFNNIYSLTHLNFIKMEDLQLDPQTLLLLEKDGFLVDTRALRGGQKFFQYHHDIEAFDKPETIKDTTS